MLATIIDTETTGLIQNATVDLKHQPSIIEFYACVVDLEEGPQILSEYETLIKPPQLIDAKITSITGLTNEDLAGKLPFADHADLIADLIQGYDGPGNVTIAHNMAFDGEMLDLEYRRLGRKLRWPRQVCTVEQTAHLKGYRLSLTNLHYHLFGEHFKDAHRAKQDVAALTRCCVELHKRGMI